MTPNEKINSNVKFTCINGDSSRVVVLRFAHDLHLQLLVGLDLGLELGQLRVLLHELLQVFLSGHIPDRLVVGEVVKGSRYFLYQRWVVLLLVSC